MGDPAVIVEHVGRSFDGRQVLDRVDLSIRPGEFVALLGRSGTGKSTLLRCLGGLDNEYTGDIRVPRQVAVVFQEPRLVPWLRVLPNVILGRPRISHDAGRAALEEVELASHARSWPVTLSGGEAQRVALARGLVREPSLLLLDEPFGALDALTRTRMHRLLQSLCRKHHPAVLLVTHDVDEAIVLADRIAVLRDGRLSLDLPVAGDRHALRELLLAELGVFVAASDGPLGQGGPLG